MLGAPEAARGNSLSLFHEICEPFDELQKSLGPKIPKESEKSLERLEKV